MKKQSLIKGTLILGISGIFAKFLGIFFRWPLQMLLGDEGVGYYQMSYPLYMFFIAAASGIPIAVSKMVSERNAEGDRGGLVDVLRKALLLMFIMGAGFSIAIIILSKTLLDFFKWDSKAIYALLSIAIAPIFISLMSVFRGFFQGLQDMGPSAVSQIIEQVGRVVIGICLAIFLLPKGIEVSAGGAAFGATAGGIFALLYLLITYNNYKGKRKIKYTKRKDTLDILIKTAIPISIGACTMSIMNLIDSALVPMKLLEAGFTYKGATILFAQLSGKAAVLINVPLTLSMALCYSIVPVLSESYILSRKDSFEKLVSTSIKISALIAFPSFLGLYIFPRPILNLIFRGQSSGWEILKYGSICLPFLIITQSTTAILQSIGRVKAPVINLFIGSILKTILVIYLVKIPNVNIYGAVFASIMAYVVTMILNLIYLYTSTSFRIRFYDSILKPLVASVLTIFFVEFIFINVYNYTKSNDIAMIIGIICGLLMYFLLIILFRIFLIRDFKGKIKGERI